MQQKEPEYILYFFQENSERRVVALEACLIGKKDYQMLPTGDFELEIFVKW